MFRSKLHLLAFGFLAIISANGLAYKNPIQLPSTPQLPDPAVIKWMGKFYLYGTKVHSDGMHAWESDDLLNWKDMGAVIPKLYEHMWAPDVFYYNGTFYMYFSNGGKEQHVLAAADSPTGPFKVINENFCTRIDGNAFMDDDGQMYFSYSAVNGGISYNKMSNPFTLDPIEHKLPACIINVEKGNFWTEAPQVFKIDEKYFINYTGNNFKNDNYQVHVGKGNSFAAMAPQTSQTQVLLLNTSGTLTGTGHNFVFLGPDLKTHYTFYHAIERKPNFHRPLCLDKVWLDGKSGDLITNGPTQTEQPNPALPTFSENFSQGNLEKNWNHNPAFSLSTSGTITAKSSGINAQEELSSKITTEDDYVAEFNFRLTKTNKDDSGEIGIITFMNGKQKMKVALNPKTNTVEAKATEGEKTLLSVKSKTLRADFNPNFWHTFRIEKNKGMLRIYLDNLLMIKNADIKIKGGSIGFYVSDAQGEFGWCGFSNI